MTIERVHHINCGTLCPRARLIGGDSWRETGRMVCHCLVLETARDGLIIVDTGFGLRESTGALALPPAFRLAASPALSADETAVRQIERLGFAASDVRHVIVTHLDLDHAGGLADFPEAIVHLHEAERHAAVNRPTLAEQLRYLRGQVAHGPRWATYSDAGDRLWGLDAVKNLDGIDADVALVPLLGHSRGHSGVAVRGPSGWLLHAGDAFFHRDELRAPTLAPVGLRLFQQLVAFDDRARRANAARLRALHADPAHDVDIVCAHDAVAFDRCAA